jgi:hypothetical protein
LVAHIAVGRFVAQARFHHTKKQLFEDQLFADYFDTFFSHIRPARLSLGGSIYLL